MNNTVKKILAPLSEHSSQLLKYNNSGKEELVIGSYVGPRNTPTIRHDEFVIKAVLPALQGTIKRFGTEQVAKEIVKVTIPLYEHADQGSLYGPGADAACFLSTTLTGERGGGEDGNFSRNLTNPLLAEKYGVPYVFGPISELAVVHQITKVFYASKFLHCHACRMGEVIDNFSRENYLAYIALCKKLLEHGIFDWSMENDPEEWGMLRPSIKLYGLEAVMNPMVQAMIDVGHLSGTKDSKYQYSFMHWPIQGLYPLMLPRVRKSGVGEIDKFLRPVVDFVLELGEVGAFQGPSSRGSVEGEFFLALTRDYLEEIRSKGIQQVLKEIRLPWKKRLLQKK